MALKGLELHHHGIRVRPDQTEAALAFYHDVLGLTPDAGRPDVAAVSGYWLDCTNETQVHVMGVEGVSAFAASPTQDPTVTHVALGVPDLEEAKRELTDHGAEFWTLGTTVQQVFVRDPAGNLIELHQIGTCRCKASARPAPDTAG